MYFRLRYIIRDFEFGDAQINISDPDKKLGVMITKRPADETIPPQEPNQGTATATCQREIPQRHHEEALASGKLSIKKQAVRQVHTDMHTFVLRTLRLARWRTNAAKGALNPVRWSVEFSWSVDGKEWKPVADNFSIKFELSRIPTWTSEAAEFVNAEICGNLDEPLGHELLREAFVNRKENLRSSLVLAVAAAEVGFKQFASKALPGTDWILENLPSPPLITMLQAFPWSKLGVQINGKAPKIPAPMGGELKKAVHLRNKVVHAGAASLKVETVEGVLNSVRDLLYFLDLLSGQEWALKHLSYEAQMSFASGNG